MATEKEFDVNVCRTSFAFTTIRVTATSQKAAEEKALDEAGDHLYSEKDCDYSTDGVFPVVKTSKRGIK